MLNSVYLYMLVHPGADLKAAFDGVRSDRASVRALVKGLGDDRKLEMTPAEIAVDDADRAAALQAEQAKEAAEKAGKAGKVRA